MEEEEGVDRGTRREAECWAESTACAKARGQEIASYIFVGTPRCSVLLEHGTKC